MEEDIMRALNKILGLICNRIKRSEGYYRVQVGYPGNWENASDYETVELAINCIIADAKGDYPSDYLSGIRDAAMAVMPPEPLHINVDISDINQ